jgi:hypothetical protein
MVAVAVTADRPQTERRWCFSCKATPRNAESMAVVLWVDNGVIVTQVHTPGCAALHAVTHLPDGVDGVGRLGTSRGSYQQP